MSPIRKVAVIGAGGTIGTSITSALVAAPDDFDVTIITRPESSATFSFPADKVPVIRTDYTIPALTAALHGQDAVVSAVGVAGIPKQKDMMDAAEAAGVGLFVLSDFGYGPEHRHLPDFDAIGKPRQDVLSYAKDKAARSNGQFSWSAIAIGNPIDWALKKFPTLGFDVVNRKATIYDSGTERFTGTTLAGIAQAVVGVLKCHDEVANRHLHVRSVETCQNDLLAAFEEVTGHKWPVTHDTTDNLLQRGREKRARGESGWVLDLIVAQLLEEGTDRRSIVVAQDKADNDILGMPHEDVPGMVKRIMMSV
ncbi:hypothetical protein A1O1_04316 [Capronia coronata CBS 617.96]|uniref:NmrA-like domain-containing protein n=1 Tax=Capronia coronata CBS 617.96 TaxID=1182541 RepID=W9YPM8_9EURO|nr:uncharacterized protein A1O1_04316 [Capronia coronata CBS 617.96]EXJ91206.1 hypothetical protein A1O1_04316 [Capronia coronata CBS 617.96]